MAILSEKLRDLGIDVTVLVMVGGKQGQGGAEGLFCDEERPAIYITPENEAAIRFYFAKADCVVCGSPYNRWELSPVVMRTAFGMHVPVIRVCDHGFWFYDDESHPGYAPGIVQAWEDARRPPFVMTAVNGVHERDIHSRYPYLPVQTIGSPLHYQLEQPSACRAALRDTAVPGAEFVLSVFLTAIRQESCRELVQQADCLVRACAQEYAQVTVLLDIHNNIERYRAGDVDPIVNAWGSAGVRVITGVEQTQMIVVADLVFTSPLSTTATRALHAKTPVLASFGQETQVDAQTSTGSKQFPFVPELDCGGIPYLNATRDVATAVRQAITEAPVCYQKAEEAGLICPSGAMQALVALVQERLG
jgi:hypothetical protein